MSFSRDSVTHLAGTFVLYADATFLNGAGIEGGSEDKNTVTPKTMRIRQGQRTLLLPYVSAQSWRRWLRNTANEENNWPPSVLHAIGFSKKPKAAASDDPDADKGSTNKISTECNPIDFPEDDLFGYMRAGAKGEESIQRTSPFRSSFLRAIPGTSEINRDEAFVHLKDGTPLPYSTKFYSAHLQAIFGLDIARLGRFQNIGSKQELGADLLQKASPLLHAFESNNKKEANYELKDKNVRWLRTQGLLRSLARLRGGAKLAAFAADVTPKVLLFAGLKSGNLLFNDIFVLEKEGFALNLPLFRQILLDYKSHLRTPVFLGYREGFLSNQAEIQSLQIEGIEIVQGSPIHVVEAFCKLVGSA